MSELFLGRRFGIAIIKNYSHPYDLNDDIVGRIEFRQQQKQNDIYVTNLSHAYIPDGREEIRGLGISGRRM